MGQLVCKKMLRLKIICVFLLGTGKTETVKDLGKNFAIYVIVQNCSEALDYKSMGKMFSGFAQVLCFPFASIFHFLFLEWNMGMF